MQIGKSGIGKSAIVRSVIVRSAIAAIALASVACGSSSPTTPSTSSGEGQLLTPTVFVVTAQKVNPTNNEIQLSWSGNGTSYQLVIGSGPGKSDLLSTTVSGTTYAWTSPRTAGAAYARVAAKRGDSTSPFSDELSLFVIDIRNVIDALYFRGGPMSSTPDNALSNPVAGVWADGVRLRVLVSAEAGETARSLAQTFADQYAALAGGAITAATEMTADAMRDKDFRTFPEFTIGVRVQPGYCGGALGCVPIGSGPAPLGPNTSIVTLEQGSGLYLSATPHEMGHAYGLGHVVIPAAGRPEFRFMMSPVNGSEQMTAIEKLAITLAREGGIRGGTTRSQAQTAGLVNPYTGSSQLQRW